MPDYPNPYEFVPLENVEPLRRAWQREADGVERWHPDRFSGRLHCVLHPETPLFIHGEGQQGLPTRQFARLGGRPGIPASSLKGAVRSVFEIVSDSCLSSLTEEYAVPRSHQRTYGREIGDREFLAGHPIYRPVERVPQAYLPCTRLERLCPSCLLFGMVERRLEEKPGRGTAEEGTPLAGRIMFSNATPIQTRRILLQIPGAGGGPHPWHSTFYFQNAGRGAILGRKLYHHHASYQKSLETYGDGGKAGLIGLDAQTGDFEFHVDFINLSQMELAYLVYALTLEDKIRHHIGYGKAYGLGSAQIRMPRVELWQIPQGAGPERFLQWAPAASPPVVPAELQAEGKQGWLARPGAPPAYEAFARVLAWPGADLYKYPDFAWFRRTPGSGNVTLAEYQKGIRTKAGPPAEAQPPDTRAIKAEPPSGGGRARGRVEQFDRGWGFIRAESGERVFVRYSEIRGTGYRGLNIGDAVEFEIKVEDRGPRAYDVVVIPQGGRR